MDCFAFHSNSWCISFLQNENKPVAQCTGASRAKSWYKGYRVLAKVSWARIVKEDLWSVLG